MTVLLVCIVAAPFVTSALTRRGVNPVLAYGAGFAVLALGVVLARLLRAQQG